MGCFLSKEKEIEVTERVIRTDGIKKPHAGRGSSVQEPHNLNQLQVQQQNSLLPAPSRLSSDTPHAQSPRPSLAPLSSSLPQSQPPPPLPSPSSSSIPYSSKTGDGKAIWRFTLRQLADATEGFNEENLIGEGGFGFVYRGLITKKTPGDAERSIQIPVAVKKLKRMTEEGYEEFMKEVLVAGKFTHPNVVKLLGICNELGGAMLVYELVQGGNLDEILEECRNGDLEFDWLSRLKVARDVAAALAHLHDNDLIHRDFKSSNVLLETDFTAKVTDFGMVKFCADDDTFYSYVQTRVMGTVGYIDPAYFETGQLHTKSDVYSYGAVLLEILTGRRVDEEDEHGNDLVHVLQPVLSDMRSDPALYMDPCLSGQYSKLEARQLAVLVRRSLSHDRHDRPDMKYILDKINAMLQARNAQI